MEINTHGEVTMYSIICLANYEINITLLCDHAFARRSDYNNHKQFLIIVGTS